MEISNKLVRVARCLANAIYSLACLVTDSRAIRVPGYSVAVLLYLHAVRLMLYTRGYLQSAGQIQH